MFRLGKKPRAAVKPFDRTLYEPCMRRSICTGERTVGFRRLDTGKFEEHAVVRTDADLEAFLQTYGLSQDELKTIY